MLMQSNWKLDMPVVLRFVLLGLLCNFLPGVKGQTCENSTLGGPAAENTPGALVILDTDTLRPILNLKNNSDVT